MSKEENIFTSIPNINYTEPAPKINSEEFVKVVESRRSVRVFDESPIPEEIVNKCLDMALLAPNSSNLQSWEFYWVRSQEKKSQLVKACFSQPAARTAQEIIVAVARTGTWRRHAKAMMDELGSGEVKPPPSLMTYYTKIVPFVYTVGPLGVFGFFKKILFFIMGMFKAVPREPTSKSELKMWAIKSTALACENLMLAFRAFGYDTCPMEGLDSWRVRKILDLPRDAVVVMAISAGKRDVKGVYGPRFRFSRDQFVKEI